MYRPERIFADEVRLLDPAQQVGVHTRAVAGDSISWRRPQDVMSDRAANWIVNIEIDPYAFARIERRIVIERGVIVEARDRPAQRVMQELRREQRVEIVADDHAAITLRKPRVMLRDFSSIEHGALDIIPPSISIPVFSLAFVSSLVFARAIYKRDFRTVASCLRSVIICPYGKPVI